MELCDCAHVFRAAGLQERIELNKEIVQPSRFNKQEELAWLVSDILVLMADACRNEDS